MELQCKKLNSLPLRRVGSYSKSFRSITMTTNHYRVSLPKTFSKIYIFRTKFTPEIPADNRQLRKMLIDKILPEIKKNINNPVISGMSIYSTNQPYLTEQQINSDQYKINIKQVKQLNVFENPHLLLNFLNNALRNIMDKLQYIEIGKSGKYFNLKDKIQIDNLMMFSGFKSNFVLLDNSFFLRVDSAKKIVRNQTVLQAINDFYRFHADKERDQKRSLLQNEMSGKIIMSNYGKVKYYRIEQIQFIDIQTTYLTGEEIPINKYYETKYQITIKNLKQPLIKIQNKRNDMNILLVPELCLMTGIPDNFDEFKRKKISQNAIKDAGAKKKEIEQLMLQLKNTEEINSLKKLGINIEASMMNMQGKIIPMPRVELGNNQSIQQGRQSMFNLYDKPIYSNKHHIYCGILYFNGVQIRQLNDVFVKTSENLKIKFSSIKFNIGENNRKVLPTLQYNIEKCIKQECNVCLIVLPNNLKQQYKSLKKSCLLTNKIICQIVVENTLRKKNLQSIATKILLQMIAKRGNTLWVPKANHNIKNTMIGAFDGSRLGKGQNNISLCTTINSTFTNIYSKNQTYESSSDKFQLMLKMLIGSIDCYLYRNKQLPIQLIIFLNSTSGDQISLYLQFLITPLRAKLDQSYNNKAPKLSFIMVNVKTNQRFFTDNNQIRNVPAGTLVAQEIVSKFYDFYIVSQSSNRASSVPNHYKVIYTDSKMEEGCLQQLIYSQCFNYVNWTGSIKVPGILQYVKKCNKFAVQVLESREIASQLQNKLYFI